MTGRARVALLAVTAVVLVSGAAVGSVISTEVEPASSALLVEDHNEARLRDEKQSLSLDWKGFVLLVPGVILTTWPVEIARWVNDLG